METNDPSHAVPLFILFSKHHTTITKHNHSYSEGIFVAGLYQVISYKNFVMLWGVMFSHLALRMVLVYSW